MKFAAVFFAVITLGVSGYSQGSKVKKPAAPAPQKQQASKPKTTSPKAQAGKQKAAPEKTTSKPKTTTAKAQPAKPKAPSTTKKTVTKPDEKADFDAAWAPSDPVERTAALKKFLAAHPGSARTPVVYELLSRAEFESANALAQSGDIKGAATFYSAAANDAPTPIPEKLFEEVVSKIPAAMFWRGERVAAFEAASAIESKASPAQLLEVASFYMSVENGAEARRIALAVIEKEPTSAAAYQTLALANRIDFQLEDSAAAYAKALELDPSSAGAKRGLAEMKRALGLSDEAATIYREILTADPANIPARTGLVLSLFDAGKRSDAETELAAALDANPGNVMLLAGAAYWYSANGDGKKAIDLAQKAIASDPRFIWSHIALARGYIAEKQPLDAERVLLAARRYGNFPTLSYEIASARLMAGFYREAAEELATNFTVKEGVVSTKLGGRISHEAPDIADVVALERKASIAEPVSADTPAASQKLRELLDLWTKMGSPEPNDEAIAKAADAFAAGDDAMRLHRELFAARELLDRKKAVEKAAELARAAVGNADSSLNVPSPEAAVMADALYDNRRLAVIRDEYIRVPEVPRATLLNIVRGRIEELNARALFEAGNIPETVTRLKRAVSVLPTGSSWWRSSTWRLGTALEADGKDADALDAYIRSYKSGSPDLIRYSTIATLYRKVNGDDTGLEAKIGPDPAAERSAKAVEPAASPTPGSNAAGAVPAVSPEPTPEIKQQAAQEPTPEPAAEKESQPTPEPTPEIRPGPSPEPSQAATPEPTPAASPEQTTQPTPEATPSTSPEPTPQTKDEPIVQPTPTPELKVETTPEPSPTPAVEPSPVIEEKPTPDVAPQQTPTPVPTPDVTVDPAKEIVQPSPTPTPAEEVSSKPEPTTADSTVAVIEKTSAAKEGPQAPAKTLETPNKELFPPVVITIPPPPKTATRSGTAPSNTTAQEGERPDAAISGKDPPSAIVPCNVTLSEPVLTLQKGGGDLAVIVGTDDDRELTEVSALSSEPNDIAVRREPIAGIKARALFVVSSVGSRTGVFTVTFKLPCGQKDLSVKVR